MSEHRLYFFALKEDDGFRIDAVCDSIDDSAEFEEIDVRAGLVAWDDHGKRYEFSVPPRDANKSRPTTGSWPVIMSDPHAADQLEAALKSFLLDLLSIRRFGRRARRLDIEPESIKTAPLRQLVEYARQLRVQDY